MCQAALRALTRTETRLCFVLWGKTSLPVCQYNLLVSGLSLLWFDIEVLWEVLCLGLLQYQINALGPY